VRNYTIGDAMAATRGCAATMCCHPMGWDAFGLPAENYAIKTGISPRQAIVENTTRFKSSWCKWALGYDWSREFASSDPNYYRWTHGFSSCCSNALKPIKKKSCNGGARWTKQSWPTNRWRMVNAGVAAPTLKRKRLKQWFSKYDYADPFGLPTSTTSTGPIVSKTCSQLDRPL